MKKIIALLMLPLMLSACKDNNDPVNISEGRALKIASAETEKSEGIQGEEEAIAKEGLRLLEFNVDDKALLQQSVWKAENNTWHTEDNTIFVEAGKVAAVYPAGNPLENTTVILKPSVNNMTFSTTVDRSTTNQVDIKFQHRMCQVAYKIIDQNGKELSFGEGKGEVSQVSMNQPSQLIYDLFNDVVESCGENKSLPIAFSQNNYVIPGGDNYEIKAVYKNSEGNDDVFTYTPETPFVRNKKYVITFKMDTGDSPALTVANITVEDWEEEVHECELVKEAPVYRAGDNVPDGFYVAFVENGEKCATALENYKEEGNEALGALVVKEGHRYVLAPTLAATTPVQWAEPAELIEGVSCSDDDWDVGVADMKGWQNTEAIHKWLKKDSSHKSPAIEACDSYKYAGITDWYLPSAGEIDYTMEHESMAALNPIMEKIGGLPVEWKKFTLWTSTQETDETSYQWFSMFMIIKGENKAWSRALVRAATTF